MIHISNGVRQYTQEEAQELVALIQKLSAQLAEAEKAMRELLSGHDNLYRAHWQNACDNGQLSPECDIATKAARDYLEGRGKK